MSSAAVQQSQSPPGHERYTINPAAKLSSSPPSSRRAGKQSVNGSAPNTPQQAQFASASDPPLSMMPGGRTQAAPAASSPLDPSFSSSRGQFYPDPSSSTALPATALPVRTSSQQPSRSSYDDRTAYSSRASQPQGQGYGSESDRDQRHGEKEHRRHQHQAPREDPQSSGRNHRERPSATSSRSATAVESSLPRENSAIINHIVVDDPQSDIARERARLAEARPGPPGASAVPGTTLPNDHGHSEPQAAPRSRQEHLKQQSNTHRKEVRFGDYILGQTLGEGEFGKVKMGWKKDSSVQVAIKLIRKESLAGNTTRLPKIYREIAILRELQHPNIVRLHEFVETERHMGIILEYASGGELFDYILNHRYLKDPAARRLFAQLVSGVGYLHKKGIVHRDLKLENLLLDRNRNIIITDFGFANTFNPNDELGEGIEQRITDKDFIKASGLDVVGSDGHRRGDLMQTSCGSPCYAAPELVVSDGLYTGRKVDVWSCGVILYAMLAGYLPFDDDPANPEGDNINLLYKYIVSTPLTFPEYVTPHARDLLRRILVPEPRRRADLFEVARHSWLSEYSHVVGFIGSSTKSDRDIASSALSSELEPTLGRSASVREPSSRSQTHMNAGSYAKINSAAATEEELRSQQRDAKRRTVQVEYVAPKGSTTRTPAILSNVAAAPARTRARDSQGGPVEVPQRQQIARKDIPGSAMPPPNTRPGREQPRATSDSNALAWQPTTSVSRPTTGGTLGGNARLPSRGNSYSQPVAATPTTTNVQGHFSQPKSGTGYIISGPPDQIGGELPRPSTQQNLGQFPQPAQQQQHLPRSHKRSSTLGSLGDRLLGRSSSKRNSQIQDSTAGPSEKRDRRHPPVSMKNAVPNAAPTGNDEPQPRMSSESRRPSFSFSRRQPSENNSEKRSSRRFSFLPGSFSISNFTGKKDAPYDADVRTESSHSRAGRPPSKGMPFPRGQSPSGSQSTLDSATRPQHNAERGQRQATSGQSRDPRFDKALPPQPSKQDPPPGPYQRKQFRDDGYGDNLLEQEPPERFYTPGESSNPRLTNTLADQYEPESRIGHLTTYTGDGYDLDNEPLDPARQGVPQIRTGGRKFENAYDQGHSGSSSGARRVMDFFRRRGRERSAS